MADAVFDLDLVSALFAKRFGKTGATIVDLSQAPAQGDPLYHVSTGSISLDLALGVGGLKRGTVTEIYGDESSGKTTLALQVIAEAMRKYPTGQIAYIDAEHALAKDYALAIGVDLDRLTLVQESEAEAALNMAQFFAEQGYLMVVLDSINALVAKAQMESGDSVDAKVGGVAKFMSTHLPKMIDVIAESGTLAIYINQIREKIGVMFGSPETTAGGRALRFFASIRMRTRIKERIKSKDGVNVIGVTVEAEIVKNKIGGAPYRKGRYNILFGKGIDRLGDLVDSAKEAGIITGSGWLEFGDIKVNGRDAMIKRLDGDLVVQKAITDTIWGLSV